MSEPGFDMRSACQTPASTVRWNARKTRLRQNAVPKKHAYQNASLPVLYFLLGDYPAGA